MLSAVEAHAHATVKTLFSFLEAQGSGDYLGESISQLEHSLQCAQLAIQANAGDDTVLGALLHDVGRFVPAAEKMPAMIDTEGTYVGSASHEVLGERYLRALGFNESICALVGAHVMAKRMLCAIEPAYYEGLSKSSKTTLKYQVRHGSSFYVQKLLMYLNRVASSPTSRSKKPTETLCSKPSLQSAGGTIKRKSRISKRCH
jgi:2-amino-1-hydroxyethylphosphonate dioxygenase (glycine-forming)